MASIGALVRGLAEVEGLEEGTVKLFARTAREAGLIGQAKRGSGAARMSARDAANLLLAVNACSITREAPAVITTYTDLKWQASKRAPRLEELCRPAGNASEDRFGDVLTRLIELAYPAEAGLSALEMWMADTVQSSFPDHDFSTERPSQLVRMSIRFRRPRPSASLGLWLYGPSDQLGVYNRVDPGETMNFATAPGHTYQLSTRGDREDQVSITQHTILAVARIIAN